MILDILIADDEMPIREWIAYNINQAPDRFRLVGMAKSGTEALTLIAEKKPHVVISDIVMPGMDGIELLKKTQEISPESRFILLTNHADFQFAKQAINYNAFDYLLKSELRSLDLVATLEKIRLMLEALLVRHAEMNSLEDSSLYFELTKSENNAADILMRSGFLVSEGKNYCILAARSDVRVLLAGASKSASEQPNGVIFPGRGMRFMLFECSTQQNMETLVRASNTANNALVAASGVFTGTTGLATSIREAERMLVYGELKGLSGLNLYHKDEKMLLVRKDIRKEQQRITELLFSGKVAESMVALEAWFSCLQDFSIDDGQWVKDICELMKNTISESNTHNSYAAESQHAEAERWCVADYWEFCRAGIRMLEEQSDQKISTVIQDALKYIHEHYHENISLEEVAQSVYRSSEYFSRQFKQEVGENFSIYLASYRLHQAKKLLQSGNVTVGEVAAMVGYPNASYFSRIYKKYIGITPENEKKQKK